ncbi:XK-related protein 6-like [Diorhabda sublineata]|uniref:XK-related protein 6-like n=1 Tax=Diorhabda sublineata TaxID=1163346 RepID=UPI0024E0D25C|nr:XK-related protein 6-like [Diorhabda sublineata]
MAEDCTVVRFSRDSSLAKIENLKQGENPDKFSECGRFGAFYVVCIALSIITYVLDLVLACILLYFYSINGYGLYFALTLTFFIIPAIIMTTISFRWYIVDHDDPSLDRISVSQWVIRIIFLLIQLSPLLRYIDTMIYGIRSKIAASTGNESKQTLLYRRMLDEDTNSALLRLFHCFLHAAPQAILQLVILLTHVAHPEKYRLNINLAVLQAWTVLVALMSIAWSLTSYHRSVRYARDDKDKMKWPGILMAFCWQLMSALSRVLALSLLASIFPAWMGCVCALHWGVMSIWLALGQHQTAACGSRCEELLLSTALGLAYVLAFISPRDGPTRYVYLAYYLVCFMENTAALVVWCVTNNSVDNPVLYYGAAGGQIFTFLLGIIFLLVYYKCCHPSLVNRSKIPSVDSDFLETERPGYSKSYNLRPRS